MTARKTDSNVQMTDEELEEIEQLCAAATAGPWTSWVEGRDHLAGCNFIMTGDQDIEFIGATVADQDFIARARQEVPRLVTEMRRLRREAQNQEQAEATVKLGRPYKGDTDAPDTAQ